MRDFFFVVFPNSSVNSTTALLAVILIVVLASRSFSMAFSACCAKKILFNNCSIFFGSAPEIITSFVVKASIFLTISESVGSPTAI
jgi:hypothetical protein